MRWHHRRSQVTDGEPHASADEAEIFAAACHRIRENDEIEFDQSAGALRSRRVRRLDAILEEQAPTHFEAPTGNRHAIDYEREGAPALHVRVQELFGLTQHPSIANGKLPLTLCLLSPAHRPIQDHARSSRLLEGIVDSR